MSTSVKFFHNGMPGAPVLSGQAGKLIDVLDACLVNGWGLATVDSVVIASGVATVTRAAGHPFEQDTVALIADATVTGGSINGERKVLSSTNTTYTFDATGISDQTATGTITHKVAPAGWEKAHSGTNLAAYKSLDVASTGMYLRVDDTGTTNARVAGYETMAAIGDTTGKVFPIAAHIPGGGFWGKSNLGNADTRIWMVYADSRAFYICVGWLNVHYSTQMFGDFNSVKSPDAYACLLACHSSSIVSLPAGSITYGDVAHADATAATNAYVPRGVSGLGSGSLTLRVALSVPGGSNGSVYSGQSTPGRPVYPNPADNSLYLSQMGVWDNSSHRGVYPGAMYVPQIVGTEIFATRDRVTGVTGYAGRAFRAVLNNTGVMFIDVTGPWR